MSVSSNTIVSTDPQTTTTKALNPNNQSSNDPCVTVIPIHTEKDLEKRYGQQAREGRQKQRWGPGEVRLLAGCIPYRKIKTPNNESKTEFEILTISSIKNPMKFGCPKGGWETDESLQECAERETYEEAGIVGNIGTRLNIIRFLGKHRYSVPKDSPRETSFLEMSSEQAAENKASTDKTSIVNTDTIDANCNKTTSYVSSSEVSSMSASPKNHKEKKGETVESSQYREMCLFLLEVTKVCDKFPESHKRRRKWINLNNLVDLAQRRETEYEMDAIRQEYNSSDEFLRSKFKINVDNIPEKRKKLYFDEKIWGKEGEYIPWFYVKALKQAREILRKMRE